MFTGFIKRHKGLRGDGGGGGVRVLDQDARHSANMKALFDLSSLKNLVAEFMALSIAGDNMWWEWKRSRCSKPGDKATAIGLCKKPGSNWE